jgi:hypothetical protein
MGAHQRLQAECGTVVPQGTVGWRTAPGVDDLE